jgi:predicted esterase
VQISPSPAVTIPARIHAGVLCFLCAMAHAAAQELVTLATRDNVTQSFLLLAPAQPAAVALLFPGSFGNIQLRMQDGEIKFSGGNFLIRSRLAFVEGGVAVAIMDTPSDQPQGMQDLFRLGDSHAADVAAVVADLKKRFVSAPVFLIGTSRGSTSAAAAGRALGNAVSGVILTSSMYIAARSGQGLSHFNFAEIGAPVLLAHHVDDSCAYTPYREARRLAEAARYPLISVEGGRPATSGSCEAFSAHGFLGKESETVGAMVNWMLKKPYANNID